MADGMGKTRDDERAQQEAEQTQRDREAAEWYASGCPDYWQTESDKDWNSYVSWKG